MWISFFSIFCQCKLLCSVQNIGFYWKNCANPHRYTERRVYRRAHTTKLYIFSTICESSFFDANFVREKAENVTVAIVQQEKSKNESNFSSAILFRLAFQLKFTQVVCVCVFRHVANRLKSSEFLGFSIVYSLGYFWFRQFAVANWFNLR